MKRTTVWTERHAERREPAYVERTLDHHSASRTRQAPAEASPVRILVVDDDAMSRRVATRLLGDVGAIVAVDSGREALRLAGDAPDLILLDYHLPDLDGLDVCRRLKADPATSNSAVMFVTADQDPALESEGIRAGAVDFVTKPFSAAVLRARVQTHLDLKRKTDELARLARTDELTGVANRREFFERFEREWRIAARNKEPISLVMLDVDRFKAINDTYGHDVGDEVLRVVAGAISEVVHRPADLLARYGGEEFAVILPNTGEDGAHRLAESIRARVALRSLERANVPVTVSLGWASRVPSDDTGFQVLIRVADQHLLHAKASGRDRVHPPIGPNEDAIPG